MSRANVLVSADWAEHNLGRPRRPVFVEVDEDTAATPAGTSAAPSVRLEDDLQDQVAATSRQGGSRRVSSRGDRHDDTVVLYGGNNNWFAAYAYWLFKLYGHATSS